MPDEKLKSQNKYIRPTPFFSNIPKSESSKDIKKIRELFGMQPLKKGTRRCLRCDMEFQTEDMIRERMCEQCNKAAARHY